MGHAAAPTGQDLLRHLRAAGMLTAPSETAEYELLDWLQDYCDDAYEEWERRTHWFPFLADSADQTLRFSPQHILYPPSDNPFLDLGAGGGPGGMVSVTSLAVGVTTTNPAGSLLTVARDYVLRPTNAPLKQRPYTWIEFVRAPAIGMLGFGGEGDSLKLVGKRGFWTSLPGDAWHAMLHLAAAEAAVMVGASASGGLKSLKAGDSTFDYGSGPYTAAIKAWKDDFEQKVTRYRRPM